MPYFYDKTCVSSHKNFSRQKKLFLGVFVISRTNCGDYLLILKLFHVKQKIEGFLTMCAQVGIWLCLHKSAVCLQFFVWKWCKFVPFHVKSSISRNLLDFWLPTVWKLQKFSTSQNFTWNQFWRFYEYKTCHFWNLRGYEF